MDQIIAKASNQAVSFAIRSGISIASGYAIKTISTFLDKIPESQQRKIESKRNKLKSKIDIVSITIDLIKLAASRGNTILESTLVLIDDLQVEFDEFDIRISEITKQLTGSNQKDSVKLVMDYMNGLLDDINDAIPILNLSLVSSGVNFNGQLSMNHVSPGRLLQAANYLTTLRDHKVGPTFDLVMYTIFYNPSRLKYIEDKVDELSCITWKETYARCSVSITEDKYNYNLIIKEDFDDGRFHEDEKEEVTEINSKYIQSMFFSASGQLLKLEGRNSPVLIIKVVEQENEKWIALGEPLKGEFDSEDEEDEIKPIKLKSEIKNSSLSLLEYLIRLCRLQQIESKSILEIPDEILKLYLHDQHNTDLPKSLSHKQKDEIRKIYNQDAMTMDSNINRLKNLEIEKKK